MSRRRWIYVDGIAYDATGYVPPSRNTSFQVMPDINPYVSQIDGSVITSRSRHREHLKAHGCVEVGNDSSLYKMPQPIKPPPGLKDAIIDSARKLKLI